MPLEVIYAVCVRASEEGIEYCLTAPVGSTRWSFYHFESPGAFRMESVVDNVRTAVGLEVEPLERQPLALLPRAQNRIPQPGRAVGLFTTATMDQWPGQNSLRRRWCLAEETVYRLRRKPLKRLVDLLEEDAYRERILRLGGFL